MKYWLKTIRNIWLGVSVVALLLAQLLFTGEQSSEVAGNLAFFMLVFCLPSSLIGYVPMFWIASVFEPDGLFAYNSRLVLILVWGIYFLCGAIQWYILPRILRGTRKKRYKGVGLDLDE